eukprot:CAMPEP_0119540782 /NCGR_PEP_ID=MMETSP1344-20130328/52546_1 /TAXON_ID=236787 /ORGANISM="Florenciella parvula, Strain CCMP2471" /LENGTH=46 /DNA_ID= /DNA_START= /DNA_END= /DNA_ORIENTATION=
MPSPGDPDADTALEMRIKLNSYGMINVGYGCDPERTNEVESMLKAE